MSKSKEIRLGYIAMYCYTPRSALWSSWATKKEKATTPPNELVLPAGTYTLKIDYPLSKTFRKTLLATTDLTRRDLVTFIVKCYVEVYENEKKYGIWGHYLGDLMLASAEISPRNVITLGVDS